MVKYLTTKNIFKIHPLFYLTAFICVITANFKNFIIFSSIIIVHELGHIIGAIIFKWKIDKVILLPFGGITIFQENIDKSLKEEFREKYPSIELMPSIFDEELSFCKI